MRMILCQQRTIVNGDNCIFTAAFETENKIMNKWQLLIFIYQIELYLCKFSFFISELKGEHSKI